MISALGLEALARIAPGLPPFLQQPDISILINSVSGRRH